jgi:hypothetical protein
MRLPTSLTAVLLLPLLALASAIDEFDAPKNARTATIYAWPLGAASPTPLAEVSYSSHAATGGSYVPLDSPATAKGKGEGETGLVRIGTSATTAEGKGWSVAAGELVGRTEGVKVTLRVDRVGQVWGAEIAQDTDAVGFYSMIPGHFFPLGGRGLYADRFWGGGRLAR